MAVGEDVYCTLVMTDAYLPGAAVLAHSLRDVGTTKKLACLITQDTLRSSTVTELQSLYNYIIPIERIGNPSPANLYLMNRPDLLYTFTKIHLWRLTQFRKIVYIDSDAVVLRAPDELFDLSEDFAAAPDVGWPDTFNTGVMVVSPHMGDYHALRTLSAAGDSFDGADQGLLNQYFEHRPWKRLSFVYNCTPSASYQYEPAYRHYKSSVSVVHFIGSEKPWQKERLDGSVKGGTPGVYQELLSRWWAVYDRHFAVSTYEYARTGRHDAVQQQVRTGGVPAYYATGYPVETTPPETTTEVPFTEPQPEAEALVQGNLEPVPTPQQRKFSAPHLEWDATRAAPPSQSRPEAAYFPNQTYEFSLDPQPFQPPAKYPEPPRGMWYEVPKEKPKPLAAIFPWEERGTVRPSRVFADEEPPPPPQQQVMLGEDEEEDDFRGGDELAVTADDDDDQEKLDLDPKAPTLRSHDRTTAWDSFGAVNKNAWDEVTGIEDYVRALTAFQRNKGNLQVLPHDHSQKARDAHPQQHILSSSNELDPVELVEKVRQRRESLLLTDFPTEVERPSLSVTPAPRRRPSFWGSDGEGDLPPAEGVPEQVDWNPDTQLEELRRNSLTGPANLKLPSKESIPTRTMPSTSASIPEEPATDVDTHPTAGISGGNSPHGLDRHSGPLDGTIASPLSPSMIDVAAKGGLFGEPVNSAERSDAGGDAPAPPEERERSEKAAVSFSEPGFGAEKPAGENGGAVKGSEVSQTRKGMSLDESVAP